MNVNDGKWFRSMGAEKLMEAEEKFFRSISAETEKKKKEWLERGELIVPIDIKKHEDCFHEEAEIKDEMKNLVDPEILYKIAKSVLIKGKINKREVKDMAEIKEAIVLEAVPNDIIVVDNTTDEKMILLNVTSTNCDDYYIAVQKNGDMRCGSVDEIKVLLSDEQKRLLE